MENIEIARIFEEIADLLDILGENPFRIRAYRNAARTVQALPTPVEVLIAEGRRLDELPGIGKDLAGKITEIVQTGTLPLLRELEARLPAGVVEMMRIPGIGPKRARELYEKLGIRSVADLEAAVKAGRLRQLRGFGQVLEERILQGIAQHRAHIARFRLADADAYARPIVERLRRVPGVTQLEIAGSYRRRRETVGDLDILVAAADGEAVAEQFVTAKGVRQVLARGATKSSILLDSGLQVDLRVVPAEAFGAALHYFTGSKAHNIAIRTLGVRRGLKINEYGIFRGRRRAGGRAEEEVFAAVGLPWIPPELREDGGEIAAAREGRLPALVRLEDLRGDLQMHTTYTDGKHSLAEMVEACRRRGYEYVAITDHTQAVRVAGGLTREGFRRQFREIERLQKTLAAPVILKGAEVDILEDGRLDLDEATLAELDVVVVSVHSKFNLTKAAMTKRIVRALAHPRVNILGHPTGRLLGRREPYPLDLEEVIKAARDHGVMLEINAQPDRLDLNDTAARMAKDRGVKLVISTDAHSVDELACLRYGVDQARRGWCEAADIANTRPLAEFRKLLRK
ncbi:MAG TPA: DNA polymerase/3'-5' exonuclease PolX [Vicinamibacterales bacterium]|nr:DNA polymerase/3'-5' exonuclease PolX [Vicinamibacterales bacterium]